MLSIFSAKKYITNFISCARSKPLHFVMVNVGMDLLLCKLNAYGTNKYGKMGYIYNTNHLSNRNPNSSMHFPLVSHLIYKTFATDESGKNESS